MITINLGTASPHDTIDGVPKVICRFGKVVNDINCLIHVCCPQYDYFLNNYIHGLPNALFQFFLNSLNQQYLQGQGVTAIHQTKTKNTHLSR